MKEQLLNSGCSFFYLLKKNRGGIPVFTCEGFNGMFLLPLFISKKGGDFVWIRNEDRNGQRVLDEVEIGRTLWVEIPDGKGVQHVQPGIKRKCSKNLVSAEACLEEADN